MKSIFVGIVLVIYLLLSSFFIIAVHINYFESLNNFTFLRAHIFCGLFGMLGATVAAMRKYYKYLITIDNTNVEENNVTHDWSFGWVYYYLTRPILGAVLGALTYLLSFLGFQILSDSNNLSISNEGSYLLFSLAFISGFSVSHALDRLEDISKQIFQKD